MIIKKLIDFYKTHFEICDDETLHETFLGELNYESGKVFYLVFIFGVMLLPFIPQDLQMHPYPVLVVSLKISILLLCIVLVSLRFTARFKNKPKLIFMIILMYLYLTSALIMASSGEYSAIYVSSFAALFLVPAFTPLTLRFKCILTALGLSFFTIASLFFVIDLSDVPTQKAVATLFLVAFMSLVVSYGQQVLRFKAWEQRKELKLSQAKELEIGRRNLEIAEESNRAKSKFLAKMSHEMRTPMNSVRGLSEIQLQKGNHPPETEEAFSRIYNSSSLLLSIINDILDLSKVEAGKMEIMPSSYDTASMIVDTVQLNIMYIGSKMIDFDLYVDENLPVTLIGDEIRIKQILNNLLSNSFKYTEKGIVKLSLHIEECEDDIILVVAVSDTGQGMTPEQLDNLFDEFARFNERENYNIEGSGLGLTIVHQLVQMMDGSVSVASEVGKGTTFTLRLPQKKSGEEVLGANAATSLQNLKGTKRTMNRETKIDIEPMPYGRVLVVDDVEANLYVAEGFLSAYEIKVELAESGALAISKIEAGEEYDIIFMDQMMPEMDGIETTKILRKMGYSRPIVALTANAFSDSMQMFMENGFSGYASKPIDFEQMDSHLKRFIRDKQ